MPIIIEGGSRCAGWWWARHLQNTEKNERAELVAIKGLDSESVPELFRELHALAQGTKATNYLYQANINPRADEQLTPEQWHEAVEILGRNLGLGDQPYFVIEHEKEGRTHRHVVWSRIDLEHMKAIPDSLTAQKHEQTSRELETKFGLEPGRSILVPDREFERPERRAQKHERFRGAQHGIDPRAIGNELKALRERSDNGQSFRAGMEAAGYVLARGDRRDYVVVDQAGGDHNLARPLGMKAAELRQFMRDVDAKRLPSVAEAKTRQEVRRDAMEARQKHGRAGQGMIAPGPDNTRTSGPQTGRERPAAARAGPEAKRPEWPLNPMQGAIRAAWSLSRTAGELEEALAARGIALARVTEKEARANRRRRAFAAELGRVAPAMHEAEIVAVDARGQAYRLDPRTAGVERGEIAKRLAGIEASTLLSVSDTREAMREASRAAAAEARRSEYEKTRPATPIEQAILDCRDRAQRPAGIVSARDGESIQLNGAPALAAALDRSGIAIVRANAGDIIALDALRRDEELAQMAADINREARRPQHFAVLDIGEISAVDRAGNVHRLNPHKLDLEQLASRLIEAADGPAGTVRLPSVTEARAAFEVKREAAAALRQDIADEWRMQRAGAADVSPTAAGPVHDRGVRDIGDATGRLGGSFVSALGRAAEFLANLFAPPPPPTKDQAERMERDAGEQAVGREAAGRDAQLYELNEQIRSDDDLTRRLEAQLRRDLSTSGRDNEDYSRGRERER
ncbi:MAG TPA: relaxase/mobilization nuclease domain-containing protein [Stellaceae bacterium]|nr:relaxase/mobilization nuclease domain-containing protein [Stellaceae bacterium]